MSNPSIVTGIYDAFAAGDMASVLGAMSADMVWNEAENHPYADGNPYIGPDTILSGMFMRLGSEWDNFAAVPDQILDAGDHIIALGHYSGTSKATGIYLKAQFAHVWKLADGKAVTFQQYTDTFQFARANGG